MNKSMIFLVLMGALTMQGCQQKAGDSVQTGTGDAKVETTVTDLRVCEVRLGDLTFTHALNGGDTCVEVRDKEVLAFRCTEGRDMFCDPNEGKLTNNTVPALFMEVDNTRPFTFTAKVTPEFTENGLYNAADLLVFANDTLWQKLCFEQDERGQHRIVTVRTQGTSDDNNHEKLTASVVYLKFSSDTHTLASYYSLDKKE